ncbi:MAG: hypothetical protein ACE37D_07250 [Pseudomonadales bacterium]
MKPLCRKLFSFILTPLERGSEQYAYKPSHRLILIVMSCLFMGLAALVVMLMPGWDSGYWLPVLVFGGTGLLGLVVGTLGEDQAVAKLWGSR